MTSHNKLFKLKDNILNKMKLSEIKDKYKELQMKYSLPNFDDLDHEFEIRDITNENIILRDIKDRILDHFDEYNQILEGIVQPDNNIVQIYESKVFDDNKKNDVFMIFKRFMYLDRFALETAIEDGDEKVAEFINVSYKEWFEIKPKLLKIIVSLKEGWISDDEEKTSLEYCG